VGSLPHSLCGEATPWLLPVATVTFEKKSLKQSRKWYLLSGKKQRIKIMRKATTYGRGYLGTTKTSTGKGKERKITQAYRCWRNMMSRCYDPSYLVSRPTYAGCEVCEEWWSFDTFAKWHGENYSEGLHLDKDILSGAARGKLYSPDLCCFVTCERNNQYTNERTFEMIDPEGRVWVFRNMRLFAEKFGLRHVGLACAANGHSKSYFGWKPCPAI